MLMLSLPGSKSIAPRRRQRCSEHMGVELGLGVDGPPARGPEALEGRGLAGGAHKAQGRLGHGVGARTGPHTRPRRWLRRGVSFRGKPQTFFCHNQHSQGGARFFKAQSGKGARGALPCQFFKALGGQGRNWFLQSRFQYLDPSVAGGRKLTLEDNL